MASARYLKQNPAEAEALAEDIFIHVTGFLRDPECFQAVRKTGFPQVAFQAAASGGIRVRVEG